MGQPQLHNCLHVSFSVCVNGEDSIPVTCCMEFDSDVDGTKDFCRILGMMHMTRRIASEEQD